MKNKADITKGLALGKKAAERITKKGIPCTCEIETYNNGKEREIILEVDGDWAYERLKTAKDLDAALGLPVLYFTGRNKTYAEIKTALETQEANLLRDWGWAV